MQDRPPEDEEEEQEEDAVFVLTEAEKDTLKRKRFFGDSPPATQRSEELDEVEEGEAFDDDEDQPHEIPNLQEYFEGFDIPDEHVISMCRAYASYLVSLRPKTPSKTPAFKHPARKSSPPWTPKKRRTRLTK